MKTRITIAVLAALLLNSCIVKSLYPFFTKDTVHFEQSLIGHWTDSDNSQWEIISLKEKIRTENKGNLDDFYRDLEILKDYAEGYYIKRHHKGNTSYYLAVPFVLNDQLFIDFSPLTLELDLENVPELVAYHFVTAHSLVKVDINKDNLSLKWLDSDKLEKLLEEKRIKIQYTKTLDFPNYLLTATSEELQKFIKKYMASNDNDKWSTDVKFNLQRADDEP